jgi:hypothetical protein
MKSISKETESVKFNKFKKECEEFCKSYAFNNSDITQTFPRFILNLYFKLNNQQIEDSLRGLGSRDEGIDAFFISEEERKYYIIQFKSRRNYDQKEGASALREWFSLLKMFHQNTLQGKLEPKNKRVKEIYNQINDELYDYESELYIFHLGEATVEIENTYDAIKYISQKEILQKFVEFYESDLNDDCSPDLIELEIQGQIRYHEQNNYIYFTPKGKNGKSRKTFVFPISGKQIINLINQGTTILERNVRGYLGINNSVNKGIINTALNSPEHFYFFNNGISITCNNIDVKGSGKENPNIILKKPQIINGAQTVNSLKHAFDMKVKELKKLKCKTPEDDALQYMDEIHVLCKIMESNISQNSDFSKYVTQYSNTQNKIKPTDFYSNRPEQEIIKEEMIKFGINYNIKRGKEFENKDGLFINIEDLGEHHYAQVEDPYIAKASQIFIDDCENDDNSMYTKIFGNKGIHNSIRTMNLTKTFFIYYFLNKNFIYLKNTYNEFDSLIGKNKDQINDFENNNKIFFKITRSKMYFLDVVNRKNNENIDKVSKYIFIMDFKILSYITRQIIDTFLVQNKESENDKINTILENLIEKKSIERIEDLINTILEKSLKIYADAIKEILKEGEHSKIQKRHPKTKKEKEIIKDKISEYISGDDYINFEF